MSSSLFNSFISLLDNQSVRFYFYITFFASCWSSDSTTLVDTGIDWYVDLQLAGQQPAIDEVVEATQ